MMADYYRLPSHPFSFENDDWVFVVDNGAIHPQISEISRSTATELGLPDDPFTFNKRDWVFVHDYGDEREFEIMKEINRGGYGVVYKGWDTRRKEAVAMKESTRGRQSRATLTEIDILKSLPRHPNIVEFKKVSMEGGRVFVVMEYLKYNLHQAIRIRRETREPFSLYQIKFIMFEILKGVAFLHEQGVVHRDIKPANILFGEGDKVKICDFGLSTRLGSRCGSVAGTRSYMAPEVLERRRSFTSAIDMWSVGCVMTELFTDQPIFKGDSDAEQLDKIREVLCGPKNLLQDVMDINYSGVAALSLSGIHLLRKLLALDPSRRISARDALNHSWFTQDEEF